MLIRYTATAAAYPDPQTYVASDLDLRLINSWLARAYPIAGVSSTNVIVDSNYTVPFDCNKTKWVTHLVRELDRRISGQIGRKECVHFTIDHQLNGYEQLDEQIRTAIRESSIFLLIGSNGYLASDWCMNQELSQFLGDFGGERIFIVEKMPYNRAALPRPVANRVGRAS